MQFKAVHRFARISPTKARLVADSVRKLPINDALDLLRNIPQRGATFIDKVICSAWANAQQVDPGLDEDDFRIAEARIDQGPVLKRYRPRARGATAPIRKPSSHITIVISDEPLKTK